MKKINKTYCVLTLGCQMNSADSERLAAFLIGRGFKAEADFKKADVVVVNTCGIRQAAENRAYSFVEQTRQTNPAAKIVIAGCLSRRADVQERLAGSVDLFLPISELPRLGELLADKEKEPYFSLDEVRLKQGEKYLDIAPQRASRYTAYIPIGNGCNNFCSYCVVPYARGREVYRSAADILAEARALAQAGYKEIVLIAQNVNSYQDGRTDFPKLLARVARIPGKFWIRFSSSHPKDVSPELIKVMGVAPKICPHLHLAVQSGDDQILKAMNRKYTARHFTDLIKRVRAARPGIAITTDVIVGFPGETRAQFENTLKLFRSVKFDLAYIARYSPRPGTVSYKMKDDVSTQEKKRRAALVNDTLKKTALVNNKKSLGKTVEVLLEGRTRRGKYFGKSGAYQTVMIEAPLADLVGEFVKVKVTKAMAFGLEGVWVK